MIKVFLILSTAVLLGSAVFGWMNREEFIETRLEKDKKNKAIAQKISKTDAEITKLKDELYVALDKTHAEFDEAELGTERYQRNIVEQDNLLAEAMGKKSRLMEEKAEYDQVIADLRLKFEGITLEELPDRIEDMKKELANAQKEEEELTKQVAAMNKRVEKGRSTVGTFQKRQAERSQGIALNGTEGTITAVNQDWGFVVVNIGKNQGVSADSELIVMRAGEIVGKLAITSIEPRLTVADIRYDTLKDGATILPGDVVIFEKLQN